MRRIVVVAGAALLLIAMGWATPRLWPHAPALTGIFAGPLSGGRVYGVAEVAAGLAHDPTHWLGSILRVRGVMVGSRQRRDVHSGWESMGPPRLADPATVAVVLLGPPRVTYPANMAVDVPLNPALALPVSWGAPDLLVSWLRWLPLLGGALPRPQTVQWDRLATYRVQLRVAPGRACPDCYEAVLLDAA